MALLVGFVRFLLASKVLESLRSTSLKYARFFSVASTFLRYTRQICGGVESLANGYEQQFFQSRCLLHPCPKISEQSGGMLLQYVIKAYTT